MENNRNTYYLIQKNSVIDICDTIRKSIGSIKPIPFSSIANTINTLTYEPGIKRIKTGLIGMRDCYIFNSTPQYGEQWTSTSDNKVNGYRPYAIIKLNTQEVQNLPTEDLATEQLISLPFSDPVYGYWNNSKNYLYMYAPYNNITFVEKSGNFFTYGNKCANYINFNYNTLFYYVEDFMWGGIQGIAGGYVPQHAKQLAFAANGATYRGYNYWDPRDIPACCTNIFCMWPASWDQNGAVYNFDIPNGNNIVNMAQAFQDSWNIFGDGWSGPNVINMASAFRQGHNLTGNGYVGENVINAFNAYYYCENMQGTGYCGNNVINFSRCFNGCYRLSGGALGHSVVDASYAYSGCYNLQTINLHGPFENLINTAYTFYYCQNMIGNINFANSTNLTNAYEMFYNARNIGPALNFSNCVNLINTYYMLHSYRGDDNEGFVKLKDIDFSYCTNLTNVRATFYNCHKVTDLNFYGCTNLQNIWLGAFPNLVNLNIDETMVSNSMDEMYSYSDIVTNVNLLVFPRNISSLNRTFASCYNLEYVNLTPVAHLETLNGTFAGASKAIPNLNLAQMPNLKDISYCFENCNNIQYINLQGVNNVLICNSTFNNCRNLVSLDISSLNNSESFVSICNNCRNLQSVILPNKLPNMYKAFENCTNLTSITPKPNLDNTLCNFIYMNCTSLPVEYLQLPTTKTSLSGCFYGCTQLTGAIVMPDQIVNAKSLLLNTGISSITLSNNLQEGCYLCQNAASLKTITCYNYNFGNIAYMFGNCKNLDQDHFQVDNATNVDCLFYNSRGLRSFALNTPTALHSLRWLLYNCDTVTTLSLPQYNLNTAVNNLWLNSAFYNCFLLKCDFEFNIGMDNQPLCMPYAFYNCANVNNIKIIGTCNNANFERSFYKARNLRNLELPQVTENSASLNYAFTLCSNLVTTPEKILSKIATNDTYYAVGTFESCANLTGAPILPKNVQNIQHMYRNCPNISGDVIWSQNADDHNKISTLNMIGCFYNRTSKSKRISIYVNKSGYLNSYLYNYGYGCSYLCANNQSDAEKRAYKWSLDSYSKCYYSSALNIYVYYTL